LQTYNIQADYYHAGLTHEERQQKQQQWILNQTRCIVCTNAFGMGIDKADVRLVVHYDLPDCLENYYQEAGRAGRDEQKAYAVLLYQEKDVTALQQQIALRFPPVETIRNVYQAVANYLQIPSGMGEGNYYAFDITDFSKKFQLDAFTVMPCLKVLEQEEYIAFNEQVFLPARLQFICDKDALYLFQKDFPQLEPVVTMLLRIYEGVFDHSTAIYERSVAYHLSKEVDEVKAALRLLHQYNIIRYEPQKDSPQLYFIYNRIRAEEVQINEVQYRARKERYTKRLQQFIAYVQDSSVCRSKRIGQYFNDLNMTDCGVCDTCLQKKRNSMNAEEFESIRKRIEALVGAGEMAAEQLLQQMKGISKEKTWTVITFLQAENKLLVNEQGNLILK
jgi:ATP-dependent DNA helicase RecQ